MEKRRSGRLAVDLSHGNLRDIGGLSVHKERNKIK